MTAFGRNRRSAMGGQQTADATSASPSFIRRPFPSDQLARRTPIRAT
eukprot:CAMPEP_0180787826 /NCGR_PEP_ID=MMETSP1038_2-20121128/51615_1 /TAXON_ID=632150 /ORGANISM="Azadinium spinosum, Strain 3D9" /LENGTH=46 /DNA_ID= /DNA_START= /DNA_END= /DNA_ORIENTATION=